jgi:excisionase family DNA binding protein
MSEFLSTRAVAKRLGYCDDRIRQFCEAGRFPGAWQAGNGAHWRIPAADVEAFIAASRPKPVRGGAR